MLIQEKHLPRRPEAEIRTAPRHVDLPDQTASRRPDVHAVPAPAVHVACCVALDSVRDAAVGHGEEPLVGEKGGAVAVDYVECVAGSSIIRTRYETAENGTYIEAGRSGS